MVVTVLFLLSSTFSFVWFSELFLFLSLFPQLLLVVLFLFQFLFYYLEILFDLLFFVSNAVLINVSAHFSLGFCCGGYIFMIGA